VQFKVASVDERDPVSALLSRSSDFDTLKPDTASGPGALTVAEALQYGSGEGLKPILEVLQIFVNVFHSPRNHVVTLNLGNADGVAKLFRLFGGKGDTFLADEFTFSALSVAAVPHGVKWAPVRLDKGGMIPDDLEHILKTWDEKTHASRRPHVLYTIPFAS
jgi:aromatic amino acid aminotransferase I / 2-aminoadipate transaminase